MRGVESKEDCSKGDDSDDDQEGQVRLNERTAACITATHYQQPPDANHCPVFFSQVLEIVEGLSDVTMAVVTAEAVIALFVGLICLVNSLIEAFIILLFDSEPCVFPSAPECEVIDTDVVGPRKVVNLAICLADAGMTDARNEPGNAWQSCPGDTEWESSLGWVYFDRFT